MLESGAWLILPGCKPIAFIFPCSFSLARSSVLASFHFEEHDSFDGLCLSFGEKSRLRSLTFCLLQCAAMLCRFFYNPFQSAIL